MDNTPGINVVSHIYWEESARITDAMIHCPDPIIHIHQRGEPWKEEKCPSERPQPPALHLKWVRALDMLIWPLLSILNLHQTNFIEHSKNLLNECKLVTLLLAIMIHLLDNIDIRVYKRLMMFYKAGMIHWCSCAVNLMMAWFWLTRDM